MLMQVNAFTPSALAPEDIQAFVRRAIDGEIHRKYKINDPPTDRPVLRIYADGMYSFRFLTRASLTRPPSPRRVRSFPFWVEFSV
jgi:hypothetical protein